MASLRNPAFSNLNVEEIDISKDFPIDNGGDFILHTIDATYFSVHRLILSLASPVFGDMLNIGTGAEETAADAWTNAATIDSLLKCIYPSKTAPTALEDLEHIALVLRAAHKYEIAKVIEMLGKEIILVPRPTDNSNKKQNQNRNSVRSPYATHLADHPVHSYALGRLYDIPSLREAAVKATTYICANNTFDEADVGCKEVDEMPTAWFRDFKKECMAAYLSRKRCGSCGRDYY
ncbi:hypothetical protein HGRIS_012310 [Hohenbuehelia grisea]|uniref:BTB domain-containing protein n=1 Tax=Hohenbuehelia grisea TaxID=104357 RepID=A0ABR3IRX5_9AGAR